MTKIVGILNITPDSFSDGDEAFSAKDAMNAANQLIADGADVVDVGAESTRPDATPLTHTQEWERLEPVLADIIVLCHQCNRLISLDTRHPETAQKAIALGVDMINDVSGGSDEMLQALSGSNVSLVLMHSLSVPVDRNIVMDDSVDVINELILWFKNKMQYIEKYNINKVVFDPGIGFGKTTKQSLEIIMRCHEFAGLAVPIYIGHSRKSFLSLFSDGPAQARDDLTLAFSAMMKHKQIGYLRVHNVARHKALWESLDG